MPWVVIEHEGKKLRVLCERVDAGVWVSYPGGAALVRREAHAAAQARADDEVRAPMTARVVAVKAAIGQRVEEGQLVVILEAMKMEYRLAAPRAGVVAAVHCAA